MKIPQQLKGKDLFKFLVDNKKALINEKKSLPVKYGQDVEHQSVVKFITKTGALKDSANGETEDPINSDVLRVETVANTALWMDSQSDVLLIDAGKKSIADRKQYIVHLSNHIYQIQNKVGEVVDIQLRMMNWRDLGVDIPGQTQVIVFITDVMKSYDEKIFNQYKAGKIQQHSIGLQYVYGGIELAINDPDFEKEIDFWNKYIDSIGNKDAAIEQGYFWVISEFKLLENSAVLFGSNILTPTLSVGGKGVSQNEEEINPDDEQEPDDCTGSIDWGSLSQSFTLN